MCPCTVIHSVGHVSLRRSTTASNEGRSDDVVGDTDDDDDKSQCSTQEAVCVPFVLGYCLQRNICYVSRLAVYEAQKAEGSFAGDNDDYRKKCNKLSVYDIN